MSFESLHRLLDNAHLDEIALRCRVPSRIGRLSLTSDTILQALRRRLRERKVRTVVDLGCGQGFLGRWLACYEPEIAYVGVDRSRAALAKAAQALPHATFVRSDFTKNRPEKTFDAVVVLDSLFADSIDADLARSFAAMLGPGGMLFVGVTTLARRHAELLAGSLKTLRSEGFKGRCRRWRGTVETGTLEMAGAWLSPNLWPDEIEPIFQEEARHVIEAIRFGTFAYVTIDAIKL